MLLTFALNPLISTVYRKYEFYNETKKWQKTGQKVVDIIAVILYTVIVSINYRVVFTNGGFAMITILTALLLSLFAVQYITQYNNALRRIYTAKLIRNKRLSNNDIIRISHKRYTINHFWLPGSIAGAGNNTSCRFYLSSNGRLYKRITTPAGHKSVEFQSRGRALVDMKYTRYEAKILGNIDYNYMESSTPVNYLINPTSTRPVFISQFIRPAAAIL